MLTEEQTALVQQQAIDSYPNEAVWLFTADGDCYQVKNCASEPEKTFRVSKNKMTEARKKGLVAVIHSHPDYPQCPSAADMRGQASMGIPWGIVATDGTSATGIQWFGADSEREPLVGRGFIHGVQDCYNLIRDYYQWELGINLPDYPRDWEWWRNGEDLYTNGVEEAGFYRVDIEDTQKHDMVWMQVRSDVPSHGAVYLGDDLILHHLTATNPVDPTRVSNSEPIYRWMNYIVAVYRHKDVQNA